MVNFASDESLSPKCLATEAPVADRISLKGASPDLANRIGGEIPYNIVGLVRKMVSMVSLNTVFTASRSVFVIRSLFVFIPAVAFLKAPTFTFFIMDSRALVSSWLASANFLVRV